MEKACTNCHLIVEGPICPVCQTSELTPKWSGYIIILDVNSEVAKKMGATAPGKYAVRLKK